MARILLIDECTPIRSALARYLRLHGHQVTDVGSNRSALEVVEPHTDIVVADLKARGECGAGLLDLLRDRGSIAPIILLSGRFPDASETAGAAFVLFRPFDPPQLLDAVDHVLFPAMPQRDVGGA